MFRNGIKNYFINLKHFFTPVGTLAVGTLLGISIFIPVSVAALSSMLKNIAAVLSETNIDFNVLKDYIVNSITSLDWQDPIASLKTMFSRDWLTGIINDCLELVSAELQPYADRITAEVAGAVGIVIAMFALFVFFSVAGLIAGFFLTRFLVRRTMAKRTFAKFVFAAVTDSLITAALFIFSAWLFTVWKPSIFISSLVALLIFGITSLLSAYLVHGRKCVEFKKVLNIKNILKLHLVNFLVFYISFVFLFIAIALTNAFAGIFIGFSFVEIAFIVISLNAESYVISLIPKTPELQMLQAA